VNIYQIGHRDISKYIIYWKHIGEINQNVLVTTRGT